MLFYENLAFFSQCVLAMFISSVVNNCQVFWLVMIGLTATVNLFFYHSMGRSAGVVIGLIKPGRK